MHVSCPVCVEFVASKFAAERVANSSSNWGAASSQQARRAPTGFILKIFRSPPGSIQSEVLQAEFVDRSMLLGV